MRNLRILQTVLLLGVAAFGYVAVPSAMASTQACAPVERIAVRQYGNSSYSSIGNAVGKYNGSTAGATLTYTLSYTTKRSTAWTGTAKASVDWGIAQIEASLSYNVTKETVTGVSVTDQLYVPAKYYGYDAPKVEYRTFHITEETRTATCGWSTTYDYGYLKSITAYPFFSSCVATSSCTPKP